MPEEDKKGLNPGATEFSGDKKSTGLRPEAAPFVKNEGDEAASNLSALAKPFKPQSEKVKRGPRGGRKFGKGQKQYVDPQAATAQMQQQQWQFMQAFSAVRQQYIQTILSNSGVNAAAGGAPPPNFTLPDGTVLTLSQNQRPQAKSSPPRAPSAETAPGADAARAPTGDLFRSATVMQKKVK